VGIARGNTSKMHQAVLSQTEVKQKSASYPQIQKFCTRINEGAVFDFIHFDFIQIPHKKHTSLVFITISILFVLQ